jgi:predicted GH43/DUF377 family glycosyl hydrolase
MPNLVQRVGPTIYPEKARVLLRRFYPSSHEQARRICDQIFSLDAATQQYELSSILDRFSLRHNNLEEALIGRFREVRGNLNEQGWGDLPEDTKLLIGAYFLHEYSIESAALFNPSVVPHWDQTGLPDGAIRFVMSLRATGEGHVSSVAFRDGVISRHGRVAMVPMAPTIEAARVLPIPGLDKAAFLREIELSSGLTRSWTAGMQTALDAVMKQLPDVFSICDLRRACTVQLEAFPGPASEAACNAMLLLGEANYSVEFAPSTTMSERVLFPSAPSQSNGIEDARFVQFTHDSSSDDGDDEDHKVIAPNESPSATSSSSVTTSPSPASGGNGTNNHRHRRLRRAGCPRRMYYATFTAYNGRSCLPQLMETADFCTFRFITLTGDISNKGMALFPRKVQGKYWMLSRQDDVNVLIMSSESLYKWEDPVPLVRPEQPWEMFKMGNCGSPIETKYGWLVLTHGVGAMRTYTLGVVMLDLNDPTKIIGRLKEPLVTPNEFEREGYVPNVVYTCGAILTSDQKTLVVPYAASDSVSSFLHVNMDTLIPALFPTGVPKPTAVVVAPAEDKTKPVKNAAACLPAPAPRVVEAPLVMNA